MVVLQLQNGKGPSPALDGVVGHLQALIRGIALHAIESDAESHETFKQRLGKIADGITAASSADDLLVSVGQTLRLLEEYNRGAAQVFHGQAEELRSMLRAMTATVMFITSSSEASVKQLSTIENRLQRASTLEDTRQVKAHMAECLTLVRQESTRLQSEGRTKIDALKSDVERLSTRLKAVSTEDSVDPVSGLPGRAAAEQALESKTVTGREFVLGFYVLDRLAAINGRFGRAIGDEILLNAAQMLAHRLSGATLYRWSGPAFAAIFDASVPVAQAEQRAAQAGSLRLEKNIDSGERTGMIVLTCSSLIQRMSGKTKPEALIKSLDTFMSDKGGVT